MTAAQLVRHIVAAYVGGVAGPRPARTWCGAPQTPESAYAGRPEMPPCPTCLIWLAGSRRAAARARARAANTYRRTQS
jgi:hypothetical protein